MLSDAAHLTRRQAMAALAGTVLLPDAAVAGERLVHERHFLFGSPVDLMVRHAEDEPVEASVARAMAGLQQIHTRWNAWKPGEVSRINQAFRAGRSVRATPLLRALIRSAAVLERESFGFFNAGLGGAVNAWGFHDDVMRPGSPPHAGLLAAWRDAAPSLAQIEFRGEELHSSNPRLQLDFGAYAKGVAIDRALDQLHAAGIGDALVNLGGNLGAMGRGTQRAWQVGIRDPAGEGLVARVQTQGREAVVTSGSYERLRMLDGQRFTHILDPRTAAPADELVSVTVLHASAGLADAAATALLVAGAQRWRRVAERLGVTQVLVIDRHGRAQATAALAPRLRLDGLQRRQLIGVA